MIYGWRRLQCTQLRKKISFAARRLRQWPDAPNASLRWRQVGVGHVDVERETGDRSLGRAGPAVDQGLTQNENLFS
jgi:hypothetical protein